MTRSFFEIWARNPHTFRSRHVDRWVVDMNFDCSNRDRILQGCCMSVCLFYRPQCTYGRIRPLEEQERA